MESLLSYTEDDVKAVREYFQVDEDTIKANIAILRTWIDQARHLPKNQDDGFLERLLLRNKFRLEQTKKKIEGYYTLRGICRDFYQENNAEFLPSTEVMLILPLPRLTSEHERILFVKMANLDPDLFVYIRAAKFFTLLLELVMRNDYAVGDKIILDAAGMTIEHMKKIVLPILINSYRLYVNAYSARPMSIDIINAPSYISILMALFKLVFPEKLYSKIKVQKNAENLTETFSKQCLPSDYNGELDSVDELKKRWDAVFIENRKFFDENYKNVSNESLRVGKSMENEYLGVAGTFKTLNLD